MLLRSRLAALAAAAVLMFAPFSPLPAAAQVDPGTELSPGAVLPLDLDAEFLGDLVDHVDVEADHLVGFGIAELHRRVADTWVRAHASRTPRLAVPPT